MQGSLYFRTPRLNEYTCLVSSEDEQVHAAAKGVSHVLTAMHDASGSPHARKLLQSQLPGFSKWKFNSDVIWHGVKAEKWTYKHKVFILPTYCTVLY